MIQAALPQRPDLVRAKPLVLDPAGGEAVERAAADRRGDRDEADPIVDRDLPDVGRRDPTPVVNAPTMSPGRSRSWRPPWIAIVTIAGGGRPLRGVIRASSASPNAAVLPVPVAAWPSTSRPSSIAGKASAWIGVIST